MNWMWITFHSFIFLYMCLMFFSMLVMFFSNLTSKLVKVYYCSMFLFN